MTILPAGNPSSCHSSRLRNAQDSRIGPTYGAAGVTQDNTSFFISQFPPQSSQGEMQFVLTNDAFYLQKLKKGPIPTLSSASASAKTCPVAPSDAGKPRIIPELFSQCEGH